ncbi:MAG: hypothetical protein U0802_04275 [Candidatus Binatia bacterium]
MVSAGTASISSGLAVGAAQLDVSLHARLGKQRRQVRRPIGHGGAVSLHAVREEVAEGVGRHVDPGAVADDEVHRHAQRPLDVVLEAGGRIEDEPQQAAAGVVGVAPDVAAEGGVAVEIAVAERRVGEHRREQRTDAHADAQLLHRVGFAAVVDVDLHGRGLRHHALTERADAPCAAT